MATEEPINYNVAAMQGYDKDDAEVCEELGLDPALAYTPAINQAAVEEVYRRNLKDLVIGGMTPEKAKEVADKNRADATALYTGLYNKTFN